VTPARTASARRCARACRTLTQIEILPRPPLDRAADNPWPEWPKVYKLDYGQEEAAAKFGADPRAYVTTVKQFKGDDAGKLDGIVTVQVRWDRNERQQFVPVEVPNTERVLPAQLALLAMGFLGPESALPRISGSSSTRAPTCGPSTAATRRTSRASSRRVIAGAARASSCGRSTKVGVPRASATGTSWAGPTYLNPPLRAAILAGPIGGSRTGPIVRHASRPRGCARVRCGFTAVISASSRQERALQGNLKPTRWSLRTLGTACRSLRGSCSALRSSSAPSSRAMSSRSAPRVSQQPDVARAQD
jgi:hypothetical protein